MRSTLATAGMALFTAGAFAVVQHAQGQVLQGAEQTQPVLPAADRGPQIVPLHLAEGTRSSEPIVLPPPKFRPRKITITLEQISVAADPKDKPRPSGGVPIIVESRSSALPAARPTESPAPKVGPQSPKPNVAAETAPIAKTPDVATRAISGEESAIPPVAAARQNSPAERLEARISAICGETGKNVEILSSGEKRLTIRLQCASRDAGDLLARQILQLRELGPYEVSLDIAIIP